MEMEMEMEKEGGDYVVMLPFLAHGHLLPFVSLAAQIRRHCSATVIIATTPLNIQYLSSHCSSDPGIQFAPLFFPSAAENTENLRPSDIVAFFQATLSLQAPALALLRSLPRRPLCVVFDVFLGWAARSAAQIGSPSVAFSTGGAYGSAGYISLWLHLPHRGVPDPPGEFPVPGFPEDCRFTLPMLHPYLRAANGTDDWSRFFQKVINLSMESHFWLCASAEEFEPLGLRILRNCVNNAPVFCAGLGLGLAERKRAGKEFGAPPEECVRFLDSHARGSVVYVSFGSQNTIGAAEMMALAQGLEASGAPFLWVARPPREFDPAGEIRPEWLPGGFVERVRGRGMIVRGWAPQVEILGHAATGVFVSHCGWNSVAEALSHGVPLVGWPLAAEQAYNAKMLEEEWGVCRLLARWSTGTGLTPDDVARAVLVGPQMRTRAREVRELLRAAGAEGGSVGRGMKEFLASVAAKRDQLSPQLATK